MDNFFSDREVQTLIHVDMYIPSLRVKHHKKLQIEPVLLLSATKQYILTTVCFIIITLVFGAS